jgi:hypothetical protein
MSSLKKLNWDSVFEEQGPLYIYDDDYEPTRKKPALKKAKEVQPVLRRFLRLQAKEDAKKKEEAKKESKEDDLVLTDIETYSDSESPGEFGEASQVF